MAYTLVYSQNWAADDSLHTETNFYSRDGSGTPSATGADPSYPEARFAEGVEVVAATGLPGVKALDCWSSYHGAFMGYATVGVHYNLPTYDDRATGLTINRGAIECAFRPNATSMGENTYCHLVNIFSNQDSNSTGNLDLDIHLDGGSWWLRLQILQSFGVTDHDLIYDMGSSASLEDEWHTYRLEWSDGTLECEPEQYVRVLVDGGLVYEQTSTVDGLDLHANVSAIRGTTVGFAGLFGEATALELYDNPCDEEGPSVDPPPIDASTPCPCPSDGPGPLDAVPNPIGDLPPWIASCDGGCGVDSVADVAVGEVWL